MELLEDKLGGQISRVQQQSDRLRDAALMRVDSKMGTMEALQPKLDRRLAELSGNYKGLSDEMQAQIRRLDQMDSRLWEWRHQLEEQVRSGFVDSEQNFQKVHSSIRVASATTDDLSKRQHQRITRLESMLEERHAVFEEQGSHMMMLHSRMDDMEQARLQEMSLAPLESSRSLAPEPAVLNATESATLMTVETRLSDICTKVENLVTESNELRSRMEAQEERLKSLHTRVENKEEHHRALSDKVERFDWEGRVKEMHSTIQELSQHRMDHTARMEVFARKMEQSDQATDEFQEQLRRLHNPYNYEVRTREVSNDQMLLTADSEVLSAEVKDCVGRLAEVEAKLNNELASSRNDAGLGPRVADLVDQLKHVAPKVIEQEQSMRELMEKVAKLDVNHNMFVQRYAEGTAARLERVEANLELMQSRYVAAT
jgi:myosin heavy subunit